MAHSQVGWGWRLNLVAILYNPNRHRNEMKGNAMRNVIIDMCVNGRSVRKINYAGRTYLPVETGREFTIRITNRNHFRVTAVVSVDGLSVMTGDEATHDDPGYVIAANSHMEVRGWRRGDSEVAAFEVTGKGGSYSAQTGKGTRNTGVIGVVLYPEKRRRPIRPSRPRVDRRRPNSRRLAKGMGFADDIEREELTSGGITLPDSDDNVRMCCALDGGNDGLVRRLQSAEQQAGTGYGESIQDNVMRVDFDRDHARKSIVALYYDTVDGLRDKGVPVDTVVGSPDPFPGEPDELYCPAPPGDSRR